MVLFNCHIPFLARRSSGLWTVRRFVLLAAPVMLPLLLPAQPADKEIQRNVYRELTQLPTYEGLPYYALHQQEAVVAKGTGLLSEEWQEGALVAPNDSTYRFKGRYNVLADEFQVQLGDRVRALYPAAIKGVELGGRIFLPVDYVANKERGKAFFEVLHFGRTSLLLRRQTRVKAADIHPVLGTSASNDSRVVFEESYYYQQSGLPARSFRNKRKHVLELFSDRRREIEAFLKEQGLNLRKQEDLIRLFKYYNEL